jgi:hypothetical protein
LPTDHSQAMTHDHKYEKCVRTGTHQAGGSHAARTWDPAIGLLPTEYGVVP